MPFVYTISPGTNVTTNATANTDTDHLRTATGASRAAAFTGLWITGKSAGATSLTSISVRLSRFSTASTGGTAITPRPRHPSNPAATLTAATAPTAGTTQILQQAIGCGIANGNGWVARDADSAIQLEAGGGANGNLDLISQSGGTSLPFEYTLEFAE